MRTRTEIGTEEGPIIAEPWPENAVIMSESFDARRAAQLRNAVGEGGAGLHAQDAAPQDVLSSRFYELPSFRRFQADLGERILREVERRSLWSGEENEGGARRKAH